MRKWWLIAFFVLAATQLSAQGFYVEPGLRYAHHLPLPIYADRTPTEEYERIEFMHAYKAEYRDRGAGRPTKKDRRILDKLKGED